MREPYSTASRTVNDNPVAITRTPWYGLRPVRTRTLAGLVVSALLLAGCDRPPPVPRKVPLAQLPPKYLPGSWAVSDDLRHVAVQRRTAHGVQMMRDGTPGVEWAEISTRSFAPGSDRLLYWARGADGTTAIVAGDQVVPIGSSRHEFVAFDPAGQHWALVAAAPHAAGAAPDADARVVVVADGTVRGRHRDASVPAWSPDGRELAWVALEAAGGGTQMRLLVDGAVRHAADVTPGPCISPLEAAGDGPRLPSDTRAFILADGRPVALMRDGDGWAVMRGGERLARFGANVPVSVGGPAFTVQSDTCRTAATIVVGSLVVARDAPVVAWWERVAGPDERWRVVLDGAPADDVTCVRPWEAQPPVLSPDGRTVAYPCYVRYDATGQAIEVVTGRARYGPYVEVYGLTLSDDGRRVAYGATDVSGGDFTVYADGQPYRARYYSMWRPRFDPSGRHLAWEGQRTSGARGLLVLDGRALASFDDLVDGPMFLDPEHVSWVVRRGRRLVRLSFPLP